MRDTYIYALLHPITSEVRYIGKSVKPSARYSLHINKASNTGNHCSRWINSLKRHGLQPEMVILDVCGSDDWADSEIWHIAYFKSLGARLTNTTIGGDVGSLGWKMSEKQRIRNGKLAKKRMNQIMSDLFMRQDFIDKISNKLTGIKHANTAKARAYAQNRPEHHNKKIGNAVSRAWKDGKYQNMQRIVPDDLKVHLRTLARFRSPKSANGYKGVTQINNSFVPHAYIPRRTYLGCFPTPELAAMAYDSAMFQFWGDDCYLNFPDNFVEYAHAHP